MRLIYTDEAGTSVKEPVVVVAAIIVHGDKQVKLLEQEIARIIDEKVPQKFKRGFHVHAKDIFHGSDKSWRKEWPPEERLDFLKEICCLPLVHDVPIAVAMDFKNTDWNENLRPILQKLKITSNEYTHIMTFGGCMERADYFLRRYLSSEENGIVIAEDEPRMKQFLSKIGLILRKGPLILDDFQNRPTKFRSLFGNHIGKLELRIDNIIEVPHFVGKKDCTLIQLADVIAFSFRRCLERRSLGDDLVCAILGPDEGPAFINEPVWFEASSQGLFNIDSYISPEERDGRRFQRQISASNVTVLNFADQMQSSTKP